MEVEIVDRMGSFLVGDLDGKGGSERCILGDGFEVFLDKGLGSCEKV